MESVFVEEAPVEEAPVEEPHVCTCDRLHIDVTDENRALVQAACGGVDVQVHVREYLQEVARSHRRTRVMEALHAALRTGDKLPGEDEMEQFAAERKRV